MAGSHLHTGFNRGIKDSVSVSITFGGTLIHKKVEKTVGDPEAVPSLVQRSRGAESMAYVGSPHMERRRGQSSAGRLGANGETAKAGI